MNIRRVFRLARILAVLLVLGFETAGIIWLRWYAPLPPDPAPAPPPLPPGKPSAPPYLPWHPPPDWPDRWLAPHKIAGDQSTVTVSLEGYVKPGDAELAQKVRDVLQRARPKNPGRAASFPSWEGNVIQTPGYSGPKRIKVDLTGWNMMITRVEQLARDNWVATVHVYPLALTVDNRTCSVENHHNEVYRYIDGKLELFDESVDPTRDPAKGLVVTVY